MVRVLDFNIKRNKLELDTRPEGLEFQMIKEEIQEFFEATTLAEMVDAIIDVKYVYEGTKMKHSYNCVPMSQPLNLLVDEFTNIALDMVGIELHKAGLDIDIILPKAWDIVCECNAKKLAELDFNGKVIKCADTPDATVLIADMIDGIE